MVPFSRNRAHSQTHRHTHYFIIGIDLIYKSKCKLQKRFAFLNTNKKVHWYPKATSKYFPLLYFVSCGARYKERHISMI